MKITIKRPKATIVFTDESGYFSFTGSYGGSSGAIYCPEEYPELKPLEALHLCDSKIGVPLHCWANLKYFVGEGDLKAVTSYLGEDAGEYVSLLSAVEAAKKCYKKEFITQEHMCKSTRRGTCNHKFKVTAHPAELITSYLENIQCPKCGSVPSKHCVRGRLIDNVPWYYSAYKESSLELPGYLFLKKVREDIDSFKSRVEAKFKKRAADIYEYIKTIKLDTTGGFDTKYEDERINALASHLDVGVDVISNDGNNEYSCGGHSYLVLDDDEADEMFEEYCRGFIDELLGIPEKIRPFFDDDKWVNHVRVMDGRGPSLASYDGVEVESEGYFIYRN